MDRLEFERRVRQVGPENCRPLKCQGTEHREIKNNDGFKITVYTGEARKTKTVTYEMMYDAFDRIMSGERMDKEWFCIDHGVEYKAGPCIFSTAGGILVEMEIATRYLCGSRGCYYEKVKEE